MYSDKKKFTVYSVFKEHMAVHAGNDLYTCTYCPRTFKSNSNRNLHRKRVHPKEWIESVEPVRARYSGMLPSDIKLPKILKNRKLKDISMSKNENVQK